MTFLLLLLLLIRVSLLFTNSRKKGFKTPFDQYFYNTRFLDENLHSFLEKNKNVAKETVKEHLPHLVKVTLITTILIILIKQSDILLKIPVFTNNFFSPLLELLAKRNESFLGEFLISWSMLIWSLRLVRKGQNDQKNVVIAESVNWIPTRITDMWESIKRLFSKPNQRVNILIAYGLFFWFLTLPGIIFLLIIVFTAAAKNNSPRLQEILTRWYYLIVAITKKNPYRRLRVLVWVIVRSWLNEYIRKVGETVVANPLRELLIAWFWVALYVFCVYAFVFLQRKLLEAKESWKK